jgi:2-keto-4-pentenoate hydratase/2-oxohepta-3-ene-1,7-dioic acid hydratase in catechol pathway
VSAAGRERLPFGRVLVDGAARDCLVDGDTLRLLDRPAYEAGAREDARVARAAARVLAPLQPSKIVAVGLNYRAHAAELAMQVNAEPIIFLKPPTSVVGPHDAIVAPAASAQVDYEAELALVVGRRCRAATPADLQKVDGQWTRGKSFDTFCPLGPWVVRDAPPPGAAVTAAIDGEEVQRGRVGDMIVAPLELLAFVSAIMTLEPGDVILTGTPPGVGPLSAGQVVTVAVEGVGRLSNPVTAGG